MSIEIKMTRQQAFKKMIYSHLATVSDKERKDMAAGRWDDRAMTDALCRACRASTPEAKSEARETAQEMCAQI